MYTIGVTGGIGAGKSEVLAYLEKKHGARVIRLDDISRGLLVPGTDAYERTAELLGRDILLADGSVDRGKVAERIFGDENLRTKLDEILHPAVKAEAVRLMEQAREEGCALFVIEAALLIEDHYDAICDELWYIYAGETTRYSRLVSSRGYSRRRIEETMARQLSDREFREHTDFTLDNDGRFEETAKRIDSRLAETASASAGL